MDLRACEATRPAATKGVIRVGVAREIGPFLRGFRVDPSAVIRQACLDLELLEDENNIIPCADLGRVLTACVGRSPLKAAMVSTPPLRDIPTLRHERANAPAFRT